MSIWTIVLGASVLSLAIKLLGYTVPERYIESARPRRVLELLTVALLAALIGVQTLTEGHEIVLDARIPAVITSLALFAVRAPFIVVVIVAAVVAAVLRRCYGFA